MLRAFVHGYYLCLDATMTSFGLVLISTPWRHGCLHAELLRSGHPPFLLTEAIFPNLVQHAMLVWERSEA